MKDIDTVRVVVDRINWKFFTDAGDSAFILFSAGELADLLRAVTKNPDNYFLRDTYVFKYLGDGKFVYEFASQGNGDKFIKKFGRRIALGRLEKALQVGKNIFHIDNPPKNIPEKVLRTMRTRIKIEENRKNRK